MKKMIVYLNLFILSTQIYGSTYYFYNNTAPRQEHATQVDRDNFIRGGTIKVKAFGVGRIEGLGWGIAEVEIQPGESKPINIGGYVIDYFDIEGMAGDIAGLKISVLRNTNREEDPLKIGCAVCDFDYKVIIQTNEIQDAANGKKIEYWLHAYEANLNYQNRKKYAKNSEKQKYKIVQCK
jgi:hypothetical protein